MLFSTICTIWSIKCSKQLLLNATVFSLRHYYPLYNESNFMSSGDACIQHSRKASQDLVPKNSLQSFKKMKDETSKG